MGPTFSYLELSALPDKRHGADGHDGDDRRQGESSRVGPTADQPKDAGVSREQPLADVPRFVSFLTDLKRSFFCKYIMNIFNYFLLWLLNVELSGYFCHLMEVSFDVLYDVLTKRTKAVEPTL